MGALADAPLVEPGDRATWRAWLEAHHATARGVWLVSYRRSAGRPTLSYEEAVSEALCFGWIDGQGGTVDELRGRQYFAPRKPGSGWASSNKARVARLIAEGRMAAAGLAAVERAKADGSWWLLDDVERIVVPDDLAVALAAEPAARAHWDAFPPGVRRQILYWIATAKRPETRARRIAETAERAARGERANERR